MKKVIVMEMRIQNYRCFRIDCGKSWEHMNFFVFLQENYYKDVKKVLKNTNFLKNIMYLVLNYQFVIYVILMKNKFIWKLIIEVVIQSSKDYIRWDVL